MMFFRFILLAFCFLLSVLQTSHARDFQRQRDIIEAEYRANVRFARGDRPVEFGMDVRFGIDGKTPARSASAREKDQLDVLRQEELRKCGEATEQRIAKFIPFVGSGMEYYYGRISGREALGLTALDAALGAIGKGLAAFKASTKALFEKNLSEQLMKPNVVRPVGYSLRETGTAKPSASAASVASTTSGKLAPRAAKTSAQQKLQTATAPKARSDALAAPQAKRVKVTPAASQAPEKMSVAAKTAEHSCVELDWIGCRTQGLPAYKHIEIEHAKFHPEKVKNGVFYGDPKAKIDAAWRKAHEMNIEPVTKIDYKGQGFDHYIIPFENAGYEYSGSLVKSFKKKTGGTHPVIPNTNCDYITIVVEKGTNKLKDAYPSSRRPLLHGEK